MMINITKHGAERLNKRVGVKKKNLEKTAKKALERGITHSEAKGNLAKYMDGLYLKHKNATNSRIFGQKVYIFKGSRLITVFDLPNNLKKLEQDILKKRKSQKQKEDKKNEK